MKTTNQKTKIYYIEFLNKEKNFRPDIKKFRSEKAAEIWGKKMLSNFHPDLIKIG